MNFIKTTMATADFKEVVPVGKKWVVRVLAEEDAEQSTTTAVETIIDHKPTKIEMVDIAESANDYLADIAHKTQIRENKAEIAELKQKLADTDYNAIKYAEGWIDSEDYAPIKAERQAWRDRINELELLIEIDK